MKFLLWFFKFTSYTVMNKILKLMRFKCSDVFLFILHVTIFQLLVGCNDSSPKTTPLPYLNLNDTVKYVGMNTCKQCHYNIYETFIHTGMGQSFDTASHQKSKSIIESNTQIYDTYSNFYYKPFWEKDHLYIKEYRLNNEDTSHTRTEHVDYIVGSGQHTNSHICSRNGYLYQMPMTFYTQKAEWDLPPGFEKGFNSRFERKIGLECMACHNAYPGFVEGSENKFYTIPDGIDCERCHGPGGLHVKQKMEGSMVDTSQYMDYSIVNPGKLPIDLQFDVCQRCHLQGNAILKEGKSFYDFKPGMKLSEVVDVFLPKYKGAEDEFIMASHADRLKMSQCFLKSFKPSDKGSLRPYKESLTCVTCHNPHVSVKFTDKEVFNNACKKCHSAPTHKECAAEITLRNKELDNCVKCHMPKSNTIDIPHVISTDHFIRIPVSITEKEKVRQFISLSCINDPQPDNRTKAKAYLNQFEKFDSKPYLLDSAQRFINTNSIDAIKENIDVLVHLYFLKEDYNSIASIVKQVEQDYLFKQKLIHSSYSNDDAWTCYRIGEAFNNLVNYETALPYLKQAIKLAPFNLEFLNKYANTLMNLKQTDEAILIYQNILEEDEKYFQAMSNLGFAYVIQGKIDLAENLYNKAIELSPDYEPVLLNKVGLFIYKKQYDDAKKLLVQIITKNPNNTKAKEILEQLKNI